MDYDFKGLSPSESASHNFSGLSVLNPEAADESKYGTTEQMVKTGLEGAAQGVAGPLAPAAERALGVNPEDIRGRARTNPATHTAFEAAGFAGSMATGVGEAGLLAKVAKPIASPAARMAIENALFAAGDEASRTITQDPTQSVEQALTHIGLGAALGGGLGKVSGAMAKLSDSKVGKFAEDFKNRIAERMGIPQTITFEQLQGELKPSGAGSKAADVLIDNGAKKLSGATIGATLGHMTGLPHGGTIGAILGERFGSSILPSLAKPLLQNPTSAQAFKSAAEYASSIIKGDTLVNKAADAVFKVGNEPLTAILPTEKQRKQIEEHLEDIQTNPGKLIDSAQNLNHYMPDHVAPVTEALSRITAFLTPLKPNTGKTSMLGPDRVPPSTEVAQFNRALNIAEQPLVILNSIKQGSLTPFDLNAVSTMYPKLTVSLREKLMSSLLKHLSGDQGPIPYKTALALSLFLGTPLDSSTLPQNMLANRGVYLPLGNPQGPNQGQPNANQTPSKSPTASASKALSKFPQSTALPNQARQLNRQSPDRK